MKASQIIKTCLNPKILISIGAIILLAYIFMPQIAQYSWIILVLICPLSMMLMMAWMKHKSENKSFVCPECGFTYQNKEWAQKCAAWCREHKTCNVEIIKHAIK